MKIIIFGLSITSSWGNGHATTYRSLVKGLFQRGHQVTFFERDMPWYAHQRDMASPEFCKVILYPSISVLQAQYQPVVQEADLVILGSYVPEGVAVGKWLIQTAKGTTAFYDIDTPVTLAKLEKNDFEYLHPDLIPQFDLYLSFTGGPVLDHIMSKLGSPNARAFYCSVDPDLYFPMTLPAKWDLGYLGTYSPDRQPTLDRLLIEPARKWPAGRFAVAGPQYPVHEQWPENIARIDHLPPAVHCQFYNEQRFTLNITRQDMIKAGYSPSVRLFEAAACAVPIISDYWEGLESLLVPDQEVLIAGSAPDTLNMLNDLPEPERIRIGKNARLKILESHTGKHRAVELEQYVKELVVF